MQALRFKNEYNVLNSSNQIEKIPSQQNCKLFDNPGGCGNSTKKVGNGGWEK